MTLNFALDISPLMLEHILSTGIAIAILVTLAVVVRRFIGE